MPLDVKARQNEQLTAVTISSTRSATISSVSSTVSSALVVPATALEAAIVARSSFTGFVDADSTAVKPRYVNLRSNAEKLRQHCGIEGMTVDK